MKLSYWEQKSWFDNIDFAIVGSGIVGCTCALELRKTNPTAKIVIFEKGFLPAGASTKNAGFACFGSLSELIDDLNTHTVSEVISLVNERKLGLKTLRTLLGDTAINYQEHGGYELFELDKTELFNACVSQLKTINNLLKPIFKDDVFSVVDTPFGFQNVHSQAIYNKFEGQIDTGNMMQSLLFKISEENILLINGATINSILPKNNHCDIIFNDNLSATSKKVFITTNGFANELLNENVQPARAQVLITKPINNLKVKGTFHLDRGYYYFRNIDNRILLGGGRNLDFKTEKTTKNGLTKLVQDKLESILNHIIFPEGSFEIDSRWSGIMGVGTLKKPILKQVSPNIYCGVRLGGMGIAIGSLTGKKLALMSNQ